jgi:hypothetical protein
MKKTSRILVVAAMAGLLITSCKKEDTSAPSVSVNGAETMTLNLHDPYVEQGATASDSKDGDLSSGISTSGSVDVHNAGVYMITYTATDKAGNSGDATRKVIVRHTGSTTAGSYSVKDSCGNSNTSYIDILSNNSTIQLSVTRFANYDNANAFFEISGETNSTITVPQQTIVCGTIPVSRVFKGSGTISSNGKKLTINYTEVTNSTTVACTGVYSRP